MISPPLFSDPVSLLAMLSLCVLAGELLVRHTALRHLGTALVVIVLAAILANLGIIPTSTGDNATYGVLFHEVAWLAVFWLLLEVDLRRILSGGRLLLPLFGLACVATSVGALVASLILDLPSRLGSEGVALTGMFTGTYTGGSLNFVALASHYDFADGVLLAAANAVDATLTTVWMAVTLFLPRVMARGLRSRQEGEEHDAISIEGNDRPTSISIATLVGAGLMAVWISDRLPAWLEPTLGFEIPGVVVVTTLALCCAQVPALSRLPGARLLGMFAVYLFLAVIGALCDIQALRDSGEVALLVSAFAVVLLLVHGLVLFGVARVAGGDVEAAAVASQAAVGGASTALVLARSLRRQDLELPSVLVGSLGTAVGTYLGILVGLLL